MNVLWENLVKVRLVKKKIFAGRNQCFFSTGYFKSHHSNNHILQTNDHSVVKIYVQLNMTMEKAKHITWHYMDKDVITNHQTWNNFQWSAKMVKLSLQKMVSHYTLQTKYVLQVNFKDCQSANATLDLCTNILALKIACPHPSRLWGLGFWALGQWKQHWTFLNTFLWHHMHECIASPDIKMIHIPCLVPLHPTNCYPRYINCGSDFLKHSIHI